MLFHRSMLLKLNDGIYSHMNLCFSLACINRGLSTNVDVLKDVRSKPTSNMIQNMLVFVFGIYMLWFELTLQQLF